MWKCDGEENVSKGKKGEEEAGGGGQGPFTMVHTIQHKWEAGEARPRLCLSSFYPKLSLFTKYLLYHPSQ